MGSICLLYFFCTVLFLSCSGIFVYCIPLTKILTIFLVVSTFSSLLQHYPLLRYFLHAHQPILLHQFLFVLFFAMSCMCELVTLKMIAYLLMLLPFFPVVVLLHLSSPKIFSSSQLPNSQLLNTRAKIGSFLSLPQTILYGECPLGFFLVL